MRALGDKDEELEFVRPVLADVIRKFESGQFNQDVSLTVSLL